jgi:hypothetical protein
MKQKNQTQIREKKEKKRKMGPHLNQKQTHRKLN